MYDLTRAEPVVILTSVSCDAHTWNLVFLQLLLEEHGARVVNLGACTPDELIIQECRAVRPSALVVSTVNGHGHIDGGRLIRKLRAQPDLAGLRAVIGGKLGVGGAANARYAAELVDAGYDASFEAESAVNGLDSFLATVSAPALPPADRELVAAGSAP